MAKKAKVLGANTIWYQLTHLEEFSFKELKLNSDQMQEVKSLLRQAREFCMHNHIKFHSFIDFELEHYCEDSGDWSQGGLLSQGCYVGWHFAFIHLRNELSFCCGLKVLGNLDKVNNFESFWYSDVYRRYRNDGLIMHKEYPVDMYGKPLYDKFCDSCDNHDQNIAMIEWLKKYDLLQFVER